MVVYLGYPISHYNTGSIHLSPFTGDVARERAPLKPKPFRLFRWPGLGTSSKARKGLVLWSPFTTMATIGAGSATCNTSSSQALSSGCSLSYPFLSLSLYLPTHHIAMAIPMRGEWHT